jgi:hypothetical protein
VSKVYDGLVIRIRVWEEEEEEGEVRGEGG